MDPIAFTIFGLDVRWYGVLIALAMLLAVLISMKRAPSHGIDPDDVLDFALFCLPAALIGARAWYVIFQWDYYRGDLLKILNLRGGGLAIHGGLLLAFLVGVLVCRYKKIDPWNGLDLVAPVIALGQSIGRWGNYFNGEAHGGPTGLPWAIQVDGVMVHPTFLYESIWCFLLFLFLLYMAKRRRFTGQIFLLYGVLYSAERFVVEGLRTDSLMFMGMRTAQIVSILVILVFSVLYCYRNHTISKKKLPPGIVEK